MKLENEAVPAMKLLKLRIATGLGLLLFMATIIGGPVRVSRAQNVAGGVTLADLAGTFSERGTGFVTYCFNSDFTALTNCASVPQSQLVPLNLAEISHFTRDAAGNQCGVNTSTARKVSGAAFPTSANTGLLVCTTSSFDPTTGSGTLSCTIYHGGSCVGAALDSTGATLVATATRTFVVSDSGKRVEFITTGFTQVDSAFSVADSVNGEVLTTTAIRQ